jgi:hypothetical protein
VGTDCLTAAEGAGFSIATEEIGFLDGTVDEDMTTEEAEYSSNELKLESSLSKAGVERDNSVESSFLRDREGVV